MPRARSVWMTCSVIPTFRMRIFIAGSEFLCSRKRLIPCSWQRSGDFADAVDEAGPTLRDTASGTGSCSPRSRARGSSGRRSRRRSRLRAVPRQAAAARTASSGDESPPLPNSGFRCVPVAMAVDSVPAERRAHVLEVVLVELLRVVELVVVDEVPEAADRTRHLCRGRLPGVLRLVAAGTKRVTIGPRAQIPSEVFMMALLCRRCRVASSSGLVSRTGSGRDDKEAV